jgi:hypothetical protein
VLPYHLLRKTTLSISRRVKPRPFHVSYHHPTNVFSPTITLLGAAMMSSKRARVYPSPSAAAAMGTLSRVGAFAWPLIAECLDLDGWAILGNTCRELRRTVVKIQEQTRKLCVVLDVASNSPEDVSLNATGKWWRLFNGFNHPQDVHTTKALILRLRSSLTTLRIKMAEHADRTRDRFNDAQDAERWSMIRVGLTTLVQAPGLLALNLERFFTWDWLENHESPRTWLREAIQQLILASGTSCLLQHLILPSCFNRPILPPVTWKAQVCSSLRSITCSFAWLKFLTESPASIRHHITSICLDDHFNGTSLVEALAFCNMETFPALRRLHFARPYECIHFEDGVEPSDIPADRLHEFPSYTNLPNLYAQHIGRILSWPGLEWFCFQPNDDSALRWDALRRRLDIYATSDPNRLDSVQVRWLEWCRKDLPQHELHLVSDTSSIEMIPEQQVIDHVWIGWWFLVRPTRIMDNVKSLTVGAITFWTPDEDFEMRENGPGTYAHVLNANDVDCLTTFFPNITSLTLSMVEADVFDRWLRCVGTWRQQVESDDYRLKLQTALQRLKSLEHFSIVVGTATIWSGHKCTDWTWSSSIQLPVHLDEYRVWLEEMVQDWKALFG